MKKLVSLMLTIIMITTVIFTLPTANAKVKEYINKDAHCVYVLDNKGDAVVIGEYDITTMKNGYWVIPEKIDGHKITKIQFKKNSSLSGKAVRIPATVTSINSYFLNGIYDSWRDNGRYTRIVCSKGSVAHKFALKNQLCYSFIGESIVRGNLNYLFNSYNYRVVDSKGKIQSPEPVASTAMVYTGRERNLNVQFKKGNDTLKKNRDYTLKYIHNIGVGVASVIISGKGNYTGAVAINYYIKPAKANFIKVKSTSSKSAKVYMETQYEFPNKIIQYGTDKNFKIFKTYEGVVNESAYSHYSDVTIDNLQKGKRYYFRVANYYDCLNGRIRLDMQKNGKWTGKYHNEYISRSVTLRGLWSETKSVIC